MRCHASRQPTQTPRPSPAAKRHALPHFPCRATCRCKCQSPGITTSQLSPTIVTAVLIRPCCSRSCFSRRGAALRRIGQRIGFEPGFWLRLGSLLAQQPPRPVCPMFVSQIVGHVTEKAPSIRKSSGTPRSLTPPRDSRLFTSADSARKSSLGVASRVKTCTWRPPLTNNTRRADRRMFNRRIVGSAACAIDQHRHRQHRQQVGTTGQYSK